ncbi:MAG: OmpH family outer membrane protein [Candidatus Atribacteria bacterium]|nr:OmpH family outer membrane protein [Candidatus Atribacteria bacterium]
MIFNSSEKTGRLPKRISITVIVIIIVLLAATCVSAQKIGFISYSKISASHPNTEKINQLTQELRTELQTRQAKLNQDGKGLEETELKKLEEKMNTEWDPIKQKLIAQMQALQAERTSDIAQAIKNVGEKGQYQVIINSEVPIFTGNDYDEYPIILYGGDNLTQDVIAEIEKIASANK